MWTTDSTGKDPDAGKDWRQVRMGMTEDEVVGWHHRLYGHEFEQAPEVGVGQWSLAFCGPWGHKESDTTEWLNWTDTTVINESSWLVHAAAAAAKSLTCVRLCASPWTAAYQAPPSMGFSRQEYWSGVPLPSLTGTWTWCNWLHGFPTVGWGGGQGRGTDAVRWIQWVIGNVGDKLCKEII